MGNGCSAGAGCFNKAKAPQKLSRNSEQRMCKAGTFVKLSSTHIEDTLLDSSPWTADKTATKLLKWQEIYNFHQSKGNIANIATGSKTHSLLHNSKSDQTETLCQFALMHPDEFAKRLTSGPPTIYRWAAWKASLQTYRFFVSGMYDTLRQRKDTCKFLTIISHDVARTFTGYSYDREALENILAAYAVYNESVGYCQGMNFLAGLLLIVAEGKEEEAFWGLVALMEKKIYTDKLDLSGANKLFTKNFPLVRILEKMLEHTLSNKAPALKKHFETIGLPLDLWLHQWISSLFLYTFPVPYCVRLWDALIGHGISFIVPLIYAILEKLAPELLARGMEKCYEILKTANKCMSPDSDDIVKSAKNTEMDWKALNDISQQQSRIEQTSESTTLEDTNNSAATKELRQKVHNDPLIRAMARKFQITKRPSYHLNTDCKLPPIKKAAQFIFEFDYDSLPEVKDVRVPLAPINSRAVGNAGFRRDRIKKIEPTKKALLKATFNTNSNTTISRSSTNITNTRKNTQMQQLQKSDFGRHPRHQRSLSNHGYLSKLKLVF